MDDKDFRKHLQDLAHGHHHPEEHDWAKGASAPAPSKAKAAPKKAAKKKSAK